MKFEVYCDEANPDILNSSAPRVKYLMIGSLWLPAKMREEVKQQIKELRSRHKVWGEIKWSKVAPNRQDFYLELIDLFLSYGKELRFRCIAVNSILRQICFRGGTKKGANTAHIEGWRLITRASWLL